MGKFFSRLVWMILIVIIAIFVGMISPGQWLTQRQDEVKKLYNNLFRFSNTPVAENFVPSPFDLKIVYLKNTEGRLETYLINAATNEMLPIVQVEGTTQVGDVAHRFRGIGEEGRNRLKDIFENARDGGSTALDKALQLLGQ